MDNKYSIILPVKNGGQFVKECIQSILNQTDHSFNVIILDSGSTDDTLSYIESLHDYRIELYTTNKPLTIEENWSRIKEVSKNEFITIIGHDDLLMPDYLKIMTQLIKAHPHASLYQTHFRFIDSNGNFVRSCKPMAEVQSV